MRGATSSGSRFEKEIGFSRAVRINQVIAVSGTAPLNPDGTTAHTGNLYSVRESRVKGAEKLGFLVTRQIPYYRLLGQTEKD